MIRFFFNSINSISVLKNELKWEKKNKIIWTQSKILLLKEMAGFLCSMLPFPYLKKKKKKSELHFTGNLNKHYETWLWVHLIISISWWREKENNIWYRLIEGEDSMPRSQVIESFFWYSFILFYLFSLSTLCKFWKVKKGVWVIVILVYAAFALFQKIY